MTPRILSVLTAALLTAAAAHADTLDFTGLPTGNLGPSVAVGGVTIEGTDSLRNQSNQYFQNAGGSVCAQKGSAANCRGDMNIKFNGKVKKLSFASAGYQAGDVATIVLYRGKNVIGSTGFSWNGKVDLTGYKGVTRIKIEYEGVEDGMAIGKVNFTRVAAGQKNDTKTTPQPQVLALNDDPAPARSSTKADSKGGGKTSGNTSKAGRKTDSKNH